MVTQHSVNGCNLRPGRSARVPAPSQARIPIEAGSLLELSQAGKQTLTLANGEQRRFLEDGDEVTLRAWCERAGARRIGFGSASGRVLPAR